MRMLKQSIYNWATVKVLWWRDVLRFTREPSRIAGALGQPLIFWCVLGGGFAESFKMPNSAIDYKTYFYPGVILMIALFASIFASVSVIEDKQHGFLQAVMAGPGSRGSLVFGKMLGSASVALLQVSLFLMLSPLAGFSWAHVNWPLLTVTLLLTTCALSVFGFAVAWLLNSTQAYHAVQMTLLVPLWVISGAMFPVPSHTGVFWAMMVCNPIAYAVSLVRESLTWGGTGAGIAGAAGIDATLSSIPFALGVLVVFAIVSFYGALFACKK